MSNIKPNCQWPRISAAYAQQATNEKKKGIDLPRIERFCFSCRYWKDNTTPLHGKFVCPECRH